MRWQYPILVRPLNQGVERTTPDKWQPRTGEVPCRLSITTAVIASTTLAFVPLLSPQERTTPDKWAPDTEQPYLRVRYPLAEGVSTLAVRPIARTEFVRDSITDTNGVDLAAHVGEMGAVWTKHPDASYAGSQATIDNNRTWANGTTAYYASGNPATADYSVHAPIFAASIIAVNAGIMARFDITANTGYLARYRDGTNWQLAKIVGGTITQLGGTFSDTMQVGETRELELRVRGSEISLYVDGTLRISATDATITAPGKAGIRFAGASSASTGFHIASINSVDDGAETITFDKWMPVPNQPYPARGKTFHSGWSVIDTLSLTRAEAVSLDRWHLRANEPRFDKRVQWTYPPFSADGKLFNAPGVESVTLDKWYRRTEEPFPARRKPAAEGQSVIDPRRLTSPESVSADRWQPQPNLPRWEVKKNQYLYPSLAADSQIYLIPAIEVIRPDKWWQPASQPYPFRGIPFWTGISVVDPRALTQTEAATVDRWYRQASEPRRDIQRAQFVDPVSVTALVFAAPESITLDKWEQRLTHPYPTRRILRDYGSSIIDPRVLTQKETVSADRWKQAQSEPRRDVRRQQYLYPCYVSDPRLFNVTFVTEPLTLDKWWRETSRPQWDVQRRQWYYQTLTLAPILEGATPSDRTLIVLADNRVFEVVAESRIYVPSFENRTLTV